MADRQRRIRSDALANRERITATAARLFAERGVDVPLDEIAAAAGVGSATLHRQFRGRLELVHSVLDAEAGRLAARAAELSSSAPPDQALRAWLGELIQFSLSFRGLAVLLAAHDADTTLPARHRALTEACQRLLATAQAARSVRAGIEAGDLLRLSYGVAVASAGSTDAVSRLLDIVTHGLQAEPA